jgi:uncharacterized protein (TIGR00369 family)
MTLASSLANALSLPDMEARGNVIRTAWDRLRDVPAGRGLMSALVGRAAPYTGTIGARVEELRDGYARVTMRDRPRVRNHLRCVHAVALANLAELTGNVAVAYSLPEDARFIVAGMSIEYLKKARGTITGVSEPPPVTSSDKREIEVAVRLEDTTGEVVARATLRTLVGPKRPG